MEMFWKLLSHSLKILSQVSLSSNLVHGREMVHFLVQFEIAQQLVVNAQVRPPNVEVLLRVGILYHTPVQLFRRDLID